MPVIVKDWPSGTVFATRISCRLIMRFGIPGDLPGLVPEPFPVRRILREPFPECRFPVPGLTSVIPGPAVGATWARVSGSAGHGGRGHDPSHLPCAAADHDPDHKYPDLD